jgi:hypothetical protein
MLAWIKRLFRRCVEPGCWKPGVVCYMPGWGVENDTEERVCYGHLREAGYCAMCHSFASGTEGFDFGRDQGRYRGYCETCADECLAEEEADRASEEYDYDYMDE